MNFAIHSSNELTAPACSEQMSGYTKAWLRIGEAQPPRIRREAPEQEHRDPNAIVPGARAGAAVGRSIIGAWLLQPKLSADPLVGIDAKLLQLAVQRRALHADELRGAGNVTAETNQLSVQVLRFEQIARLP